MFDFDVNNYLKEIKIKVFGIEYDDTISLQLKCNKKFACVKLNEANWVPYYWDSLGC